MKSLDMTKGNILRVILLFALPIFIGNILQQVYNLTDTWVVGKFLEGGISAVSSSTVLYDLVFAFVNGMTSGYAIIVARYYGAKDEANFKNSIIYTIALTIIMTIILTTISLIVLGPVLKALDTPLAIYDMAYSYIFIILAGMITTMIYNMLHGLMRSVGNSMVALICLIASVIFNIALDLLFVAVFHMGIKGVALATVIAQGLSSIFCLVYILVKMPELHVKLKDFKWDKKLFTEMFLTGLSMGFMLSVVSIGNLTQQKCINGFGEDYITAHTLARRIGSLFMLPLSAMSVAASTFSSQNYGAKEFGRIKKGLVYNVLLGFAWSAIAIIITYAFGKYFVIALGSLKSSDTDILNTSIKYIRFNLPFFPILGILFIMRTSMQALGYKIIPVVSSSIELACKIAITFIFSSMFGYTAVIVGEPIIWSICAVVLVLVFIISKKGRFILKASKTSLTEEQKMAQ